MPSRPRPLLKLPSCIRRSVPQNNSKTTEIQTYCVAVVASIDTKWLPIFPLNPFPPICIPILHHELTQHTELWRNNFTQLLVLRPKKTPHYVLYLNVKNQQFISQIKKRMFCLPTAMQNSKLFVKSARLEFYFH